MPSLRRALPCLAVLLLATLAGCTSLHSWAQAGSDHPLRGGASVDVPLGR